MTWNENNEVELIGTVMSDFIPERTDYKETCWRVFVAVPRNDDSGIKEDIIPIVVKNRLLDMPKEAYKYNKVYVFGRFCTSFYDMGGDIRYNVTAQEFKLLESAPKDENQNTAFLCGELHKKTAPRQKNTGEKLMFCVLKVERNQKRRDYLPCYFTEEQMNDVRNVPVGKEICIWGQLQRRKFFKKNSGGIPIPAETFEIKVTDFQVA